MPVKYKVTIYKVGTGLVIAIPKPVIEGYGLKRGDVLELTADNDDIVIRKAVKVKQGGRK